MTDGIVVTFDPKRGFGFARVKGLRDDVFVHASDIPGGFPLKPGQRIRFEIEHTEKGNRARAVLPGPKGAPPWLASVFGLGITVGVLGVVFFKLGLGPIGAVLVGLNIATFFIYGWDKRCAGLSERRIPEAVLLGLALMGGSPGAMLAMRAFRHKTRKKPFLIAFGAVLLVQVLMAYAWFHRG